MPSSGQTENLRGRILRGIAGFYYIETEDGRIYACRAKGILRRQAMKPLPGDEAFFFVTHEGDREGNLTELLPRRNALIRPPVANVDQALLFFSVREPKPSLLMLDRYLVLLAGLSLPAILCFNKTDIASDEERKALSDVYRLSGHPVYLVSIRTGEGMEALLKALHGRATVLAGPSGTGKSSLINRLCPHAEAETGELSRKLARGKNTTRHSELFRVDDDRIPEGNETADVEHATWLIDTPGFTALALPELERKSLAERYEEFARYRGVCRFASCLHLDEPDCAVRSASEQGGISAVRYQNYRHLMEELKEQQERKYR